MDDSVKTLNKASLPVKQSSQERLAVFMAILAGYADVAGYTKLKTYVSFMSGNTTQLGLNIAHQTFNIALPPLIAIVCFTAGIYFGNFLVILKPFHSHKRNAWIVAFMMFMYVLLTSLFNIPVFFAIALLSFSIGIMNTVISSVGKQSVNTGFVTGTLNSLAKELATFTLAKNANDKAEHGRGAFYLFLLWLGFLSGGTVGVFAVKVWSHYALLLPALFLLLTPLLWRAYFSN